MAVALDRAEEGGRARDLAKQGFVDRARAARSAQRFGKAKELAPRLVERAGIATIRLVQLRDVSVVECTGNWQSAHERLIRTSRNVAGTVIVFVIPESRSDGGATRIRLDPSLRSGWQFGRGATLPGARA